LSGLSPARIAARLAALARPCVASVERYIKHLDVAIAHSPLDSEDQAIARQEDRQGLGLSRKQAKPESSPR
jgi:hypothetical protein